MKDNFDRAHTCKLKTKARNSSRFRVNIIPFIAQAFKYVVKICCHNNTVWIGKSMYSQLLSQANKKNISHFTVHTMSLCPNTWKELFKTAKRRDNTIFIKVWNFLKYSTYFHIFLLQLKLFHQLQPHNIIGKGQKRCRTAVCCVFQLPVINWKCRELIKSW